MSMRVRQKSHAALYPGWRKKQSPAKLAKIREGQRLRAMCPTCHGAYDALWKPRWAEFEHEQRLHRILLARWLPSTWLTQRFLEVV